MTGIVLGLIILGILVVLYSAYDYKPPILLPYHRPLYGAVSNPPYTYDETIPDNWGVPQTQRHYRDLSGPAPCVRCRHDNGDCMWVWPNEKNPGLDY